MNIQTVISGAVAIVASIFAALQTIRAQIHAAAERKNEEVAKKGEETIKNVGRKIDVITIILMAMLNTEKELGGFKKGCGKCGESIENCSSQKHSSKKLDLTMDYIRRECEKNNIPFDYGFCHGKIHEYLFILRQENKTK